MCMYIYEYVYISVFITYDMYAILLFYVIYINKYVIYILFKMYIIKIYASLYIYHMRHILHTI